MDYATEMPAGVSKTNAGGFRECCTCFMSKFGDRGGGGKEEFRDHGLSGKFEILK